jgi:hypothetical protein
MSVSFGWVAMSIWEGITSTVICVFDDECITVETADLDHS